jgi:hypothetical protein
MDVEFYCSLYVSNSSNKMTGINVWCYFSFYVRANITYVVVNDVTKIDFYEVQKVSHIPTCMNNFVVVVIFMTLH